MTISKESLELVEEYNRTICCLWMDLFFTNILKHYLNLLNKDTFDVDEISETSYIEKVLENNKENEDAIAILFVKYPVEYVQEAIKKVAAVVPIYEQFKKIGISPSLIKNKAYYVHYCIK